MVDSAIELIYNLSKKLLLLPLILKLIVDMVNDSTPLLYNNFESKMNRKCQTLVFFLQQKFTIIV